MHSNKAVLAELAELMIPDYGTLMSINFQRRDSIITRRSLQARNFSYDHRDARDANSIDLRLRGDSCDNAAIGPI